jgi:hypothetical protein
MPRLQDRCRPVHIEADPRGDFRHKQSSLQPVVLDHQQAFARDGISAFQREAHGRPS